jgi:hypothetical protein
MDLVRREMNQVQLVIEFENRRWRRTHKIALQPSAIKKAAIRFFRSAPSIRLAYFFKGQEVTPFPGPSAAGLSKIVNPSFDWTRFGLAHCYPHCGFSGARLHQPSNLPVADFFMHPPAKKCAWGATESDQDA